MTEVGFRLHVGMSLTAVSDVVTLQASFTIPLKPFVPTTLMVPVFSVVAPCETVMVVVPSGPAVKGGSAIVRAMLVVAFSAPEVPLMVTVTGLEVTAAEALAENVATWVPTVEPAAKAAVTPLGRPLAERAMLPEKPPTSVTAMVLVALLP